MLSATLTDSLCNQFQSQFVLLILGQSSKSLVAFAARATSTTVANKQTAKTEESSGQLWARPVSQFPS